MGKRSIVKGAFALLCILASFCVCCAPDASKAWYAAWGIVALVSLAASLYFKEEEGA